MPRVLRLALHWQVLIAMVLGAVFASFFGSVGPLNQVAEVFLRLLRMIIVPLIFTSIVSGVAGIADGKSLGRLGVKTLSFYVLSSFLAIVAGLVLTNIIRPGDGLETPSGVEVTPDSLETPGSVADIVMRLIPTNPVQAASEFDILGLIFFSIFLGAVIAAMEGSASETLRTFFDAAFEAMMRMTQVIIKLLPIGVFALIARAVGEMGFDVFEQVGKYMVTIAIGLTFHAFVTLPLVYFVLTRRNPIHHYRAISPAMAMAFSTSSSAATLPVTMTSVQENAGVSKKVSTFVLPMGATVNMDGTALYECAGVLFIAQALSVGLDFQQQVVVVLTALLASVGAAAVPSAGLVMIFIVLEAIGLTNPAAYALVGLMLAVDRPLDMYRTVVNITSDTICAAVVAHSEGEDLGAAAQQSKAESGP
ncbi:MAG: dicarboxylate/amino acid:cation symporter [Acidobacteria bacterium]|nr:MAG: dicarboxylate/amino acid:cation symporter [Acidobacteriota bacterium]REK03893.1 MAG: dicarboxylate/amino acid:cation symporter [Acidobacteriota bacterium]